MELTGILSLAFGFGLLHALDVDHLLAVSGLSGIRHENMRHGLAFSVRWALGHGSSVMLLGGLVLFFGMAVPEKFSNIAEQLVGYMLLAIGLMLLFDWYRKKNSLYMHRHDKMPLHVHMESVKPLNPLHNHRHGTMLVGLLHGAAGSAPLLVLMPVANAGSPFIGMAYLLIFCVGVLLSMVVFGGLLGTVFTGMQKNNRRLAEMLRLVIALLTVSFSVYLIAGL